MFEIFSQEITKYFESVGIRQSIELLKPPSPDLGDFSIIVNKLVGKGDPSEFAKTHQIQLNKIPKIESVELFEIPKKKKPIVYLNFKIQEEAKIDLRSSFIKNSLENILSENFINRSTNSGKTAIVEHTSANPISPLHIGNLRNSVHGDTIARILELTGFKVYRHFYVNDVGLQVSFVILGYERLKVRNIKPDIKPDLWFGRIYAIMNNLYYTLVLQKNNPLVFEKPSYIFKSSQVKQYKSNKKNEIKEINTQIRKIEKIEKPTKNEKNELRQLNKKIKQLEADVIDIDKLETTRQQLHYRFPQLTEILIKEFEHLDLITLTSEKLVNYEKGTNSEVKSIFREVADWVLNTFFTTLRRFNIEFDNVDFESDVSWSGLVEKLLDKLANSSTSIKVTEDGTLRFQYPSDAINAMIKELEIDKERIPIKGTIPELQLRRKDGTALYAAKDIAYSVYKYESCKPDLIINVISTEQSLPQYQLLLPLYELGYKSLASSMIHYAYELVELRGRVMSGRMAMYVTADEYLDETIIRARMAKRSSDSQRNIQPPNNVIEFEEEYNMLQQVAIASTRFPLIETAPNKKIVIDLDRELDFRRNSGPFVQYAHARTCSIFDKIGQVEPNLDTTIFTAITDDLIVEIIEHINNFNDILSDSIALLDPSYIASWVYNLALKFMKFYEGFPINSEKDENIKNAKILVLSAIQKGLKVGLNTLGIPASEKL